MKPLLTEQEAADILQTSPRSIRKARQAGRLPHVQIGRLVRYRVEDIEGFIARSVVSNDRALTTNSVAARTGSGRVMSFTQRNAQR